jgi:NAD(P)-dependent dehydrogenase (short-subunit alcohol dehydrogenase family)
MKSFEGRAALVTGAGAGIGFATARAFAEAGAAVVVADRGTALIEAAASKLRLAGHQALAITCDVTDRGQVTEMVERAVSTYGRLDAAFNNAGINCDATPISEAEDDEFDHVIDINLRGVWNCMKANSPDDCAGKRRNRQLFVDWRDERLERSTGRRRGGATSTGPRQRLKP